MSQYETVRKWPPRLIFRAAQIEQERLAEQRLIALQDRTISSGLKLGQKYVDPKSTGERQPNEPYYSLQPLLDAQRRLERAARPWAAEATDRQRREAEEEKDFDQMFATLGGLNA